MTETRDYLPNTFFFLKKTGQVKKDFSVIFLFFLLFGTQISILTQHALNVSYKTMKLFHINGNYQTKTPCRQKSDLPAADAACVNDSERDAAGQVVLQR